MCFSVVAFGRQPARGVNGEGGQGGEAGGGDGAYEWGWSMAGAGGVGAGWGSGGGGGGSGPAALLLFTFVPPEPVRAWGATQTTHYFITGGRCVLYVTIVAPEVMARAFMRGALRMILECHLLIFRYLSATGKHIHTYLTIVNPFTHCVTSG